MKTSWIGVGALVAGLAVVAGAFGAHGLKDRFSAVEQSTGVLATAIFETGARYHMYHGLAILALGLAAVHRPNCRRLNIAAWAFLIGTVVFSGSLYVLALTGVKWLGAITPLGGVAQLVGWAYFAAATWKRPATS